MFRQHLFSCNCQLFTPQTLNHQQFRSPPAHFNRMPKRSKRSLKSQSSSRNRHELDHHPLFNKFNQFSSKQLPITPFSRQVTRAATSISPPPLAIQKKSPTITIKFKNNHDNKHKMTKQNHPVRYTIAEHQGRINSPLQQNENITKNVNIYTHHHPLSKPQNHQPQRRVEVSPPTLTKVHKLSQNSAGTTLAGSFAPSIQQKWDKRSTINPSTFKTFNTIRQEFQSKTKISSMIDENDLRQKAHSTFFGLSRLSEMINQKQEAQSIYDEISHDDESNVEYSRVLISCKKLMEDKKGVLERSDHTKLFDFSQEKTFTRTDRSSLFQNVNLTEPDEL